MKKLNNYYSFIFLILALVLVILMKTRYIFLWNSFRYVFLWTPNFVLTACLLSLIGFATAFLVNKWYARWIALTGNALILLFVVAFSVFMIVALNRPNP